MEPGFMEAAITGECFTVLRMIRKTSVSGEPGINEKHTAL
jgi:hypothetical protein